MPSSRPSLSPVTSSFGVTLLWLTSASRWTPWWSQPSWKGFSWISPSSPDQLLAREHGLAVDRDQPVAGDHAGVGGRGARRPPAPRRVCPPARARAPPAPSAAAAGCGRSAPRAACVEPGHPGRLPAEHLHLELRAAHCHRPRAAARVRSVTGCPSTETTRSKVRTPARSAALAAGCTRPPVGRGSGRCRSARGCGPRLPPVGVTSSCTGCPSRCTTTGMRWPALPVMARCISSKVCTGRPSTSVMTSPSFIPASAAGSPGSRVSTAVEGWGKLTTARKRPAAGR